MEYIVGLLIAAVGAAFYYKNKSDKAGVNAILAETRGKDSELAKDQKEVEDSIKDLDDGINKLKKERVEKRKEREGLTRAQRADEWKKN